MDGGAAAMCAVGRSTLPEETYLYHDKNSEKQRKQEIIEDI